MANTSRIKQAFSSLLIMLTPKSFDNNLVGYFWACMGVPSQIEIDCQSADGLQIINKSMMIKVYTLMIVLILFSSKNWTLTSSSLVNR